MMIPEELHRTLNWLPMGAALHIPGAFFDSWFSHAAEAFEDDDRSFKAARAYASEHGCAFGYDDEAHVGVFRKTKADFAT